jgi:uncharacterized protein (DUF488 family)
MKNIKISGKIEDILPYLQTGDIIINSNCLKKNIDKNKFSCFKKSRENFVKNGYQYSHLSMIYRKNNKIYHIDFLPENHSCTKKESLINNKYKNGLRIILFETYIKQIKEKTKKDDFCCQKYAIRFINRKINQDELNRRLENEINILSDKKFIEYSKVRNIATSGWFLKDMSNNFQYSTEIFYQNDENDTFFCSEIIGILLQRIGVMKRINRARMFYPTDYNGEMDSKMFDKDMYSEIKIYN